MDYERIQKPQGGGFSPGKLRIMLRGVDNKKRKEEDEFESNLNLRSQGTEFDDPGGSSSESYKDVDVVSVERQLKDQARNRAHEDPSLDYDCGMDTIGMNSSHFEFQKAERAPQRVPLAPFSKPAPSKWDDAQKWIASPTTTRPKAGQPQPQGGLGAGLRKVGNLGYFRQSSTKMVSEVPDPRFVGFEEPDTKQIDVSQTKKTSSVQKPVSYEADPYPIADSSIVSFSQHDSSKVIQSATAVIPPPSTARSVSMRDMGTEMTPIASQEPSRTGTPVRSTTPIRSPNSSRPSTPRRNAPATDVNRELSEKELQMKTRREIIALGNQLGKPSIAAWASKEDENAAASGIIGNEQLNKSAVETRAAAWEEAEKAKYMARFKREEMKIQAWENHQKAKTEAEMRKIEVEVERMKGRAHDKLMNKLATTRHKAEEKRVTAEAKRNKQATKAEQQAEYIRTTGRIPSSFCCWNWFGRK